MDRKPELVAASLVLFLAAIVVFSFWGFSYDDNFITYRYAKNFSEGNGLVFNHGERVLGTSAPGYALLLGALSGLTAPLGLDVPQWGTLLSVLALLTITLILSRCLSGRERWALPAAFASLALLLKINIQLMGNECLPVLAANVGAAYLLLVRQKPGLAGLCAAAAMCFRLDAGLGAAAIGLIQWRRDRRFPWTYATVGVGLLAGWLLILTGYFGRFIPMTIMGKKALRDVPYTLREWQTLTQSLPEWISMFVLAGALVGLAVGIRKGLWRNPLVATLGLWIIAHEIAYRAVGVWFAPWYFQHLLNALLLLFVFGVWAAVGTLGKRRWQPLYFAAMLLPVIVPSLVFVAGHWRRAPDPRFEVYKATGEHIRAHLPLDADVLALEIGVLGYYGERRILDYGALVSPAFAAAKFEGNRARLAAQLMPDAIVDIVNNELIGEVLAQPEITDHYQVVATFTHPDYGGGEIRLLERLRPD